MARRDFYEVLGVGRDASADDIQSAYRKLARTYHPDVNKEPGAEDRFKEVSEAYDVLSDPELRRRYDAFGHDFRQVPEGVDPQTWARAQAGASRSGARGTRTGTAEPGEEWFTSGVDFEDLFGDMFGGGRRRSWGPIPGADQEAVLTLTVEEAFRGGPRSITLTGPDGPRSYDVTIPPGVTDGQRIRLAGQGGQGSGQAPAGDLYLVVRLAPHPRYRVEGRDLFVELPLAPWEAALGATVAVDTPGGEAKLRVPGGTSSGRRLRLKGRGLPSRSGEPGDLYAEARIMVPATPSDDERRLFEELARTSTFDPREAPMTTYALARPWRLDLDAFARAAGLHPDVVRRFVALGLIEASRDAAGALWFAPSQLPAVARLQRLRAGFALNYAALGLVVDLLDRIARLEAAQRRRPPEPTPPRGGRPWT